MLAKLKHILVCPPFEYHKSFYLDDQTRKSDSLFRTCPKCGIMQEKVIVKRPVPFTNTDDGVGIMGLWHHWKDIH